ncbi:MAG: hypothetical protein GX444_02235 [Myxococcales bacterium]|nr:hypothetical protein [Myxococcales bacterium]
MSKNNIKLFSRFSILGLFLVIISIIFIPNFVFADKNESSPVIHDDGDTVSIESGGYEMVYSAITGQLMEWYDSNGDILLYNQGDRPDTADESVTPDEKSPFMVASDDIPLPFRLYLFKRIVDSADDMPFSKQEMTICVIPNNEANLIIKSYSTKLEIDNWWRQTWIVQKMIGIHKYTDPRMVGIGNRTSAVGNECVFEDLVGLGEDPQPILPLKQEPMRPLPV